MHLTDPSTYRRPLAALVLTLAVLAVAGTAGVAAQDPQLVREKYNADTTLHAGGTYYVGSTLFFAEKKLVPCATTYRLTTVKGEASVSTSGADASVTKVSTTGEPDDECETIFDTQGLEPGLYTVVRDYGNRAAPFPGEPIKLKQPKVFEPEEEDDGDDGDGDADGDTTDGDADDTASVGLPGGDRMPQDFEFQDPDPTGDIDWGTMFPASLTVDGGVGMPGNVVTVEFAMTNTGNESQAYILEVTDLPDALTVVDRNDSGGTWNEDRWLFQSIDSGAHVRPSLDVRLPNGTIGSGIPRWTVEGHVETEDFIAARGSDEVAAVSNASLCQAIAGTDGVIGDSEVIAAANAWDDGEPLPSVGLVVGDDQILAIIEAWREGKDCSGFTLPEPPAALGAGSNLSATGPTTGAAMPGS